MPVSLNNAQSPLTGAPAEAIGGPSDPVQAILAILRCGRRFLVCSHVRPDGDALGSMLACGMMLEQMGKQADLVCADPIPLLYLRLPGAARIRSAPRLQEGNDQDRYDAVILLECDGLERAGLQGLEDLRLINIDHHVSGRPYAHLNWIDHAAPSVGEMVYRLAMAAGTRLTPEMATCLYTTILTDTGGFSYGSVRASTFDLARELVEAGADPIRIAQEVCYSTPVSKMLLLGAALNTLHREGRLAWLWVTHQDMVRTCAADEDCEGIVNFAVGIAGIEAAAFLRELPDGHVRVSLRSKGRMSVAAIAGQLGGGGHENASGCTMDGPLSHARDRILGLLRCAQPGAAEAGAREPAGEA